MRRGILERDAELSVLTGAVREAVDRHGSVVLVMGEAGIGKSSLVEALRSHLPAEGRMLVGYCDDLATPRTLGPFRDLVGSVGTELSRAVADGSERDRVLTALRTELTWPEHPTVLVIEDVHWADDATLDALRYLIRRIADLSAVLILTYRDDELSREHPLHGLLGQASRSDRVRHLPLRRLSQQAVLQLSAGSSVDVHDLFALTSRYEGFGNVLIEAMACGVPVVATSSPGTREIVTAGADGLLVDSHEPDAMAAALARVLTDEALRRRLAAGARSSASRFALPTIAAAYDGVLHRVLAC